MVQPLCSASPAVDQEVGDAQFQAGQCIWAGIVVAGLQSPPASRSRPELTVPQPLGEADFGGGEVWTVWLLLPNLVPAPALSGATSIVESRFR